MARWRRRPSRGPRLAGSVKLVRRPTPLRRSSGSERMHVRSSQRLSADRPVAAFVFVDSNPRDRTHVLAFHEYYRRHPVLIRRKVASPESAAFFRQHDICHVIFGLNTTMVDEAMAEIGYQPACNDISAIWRALQRP